MRFFSVISEGERSSPGLNYVRISDGGFAIVVWVWRFRFYCRKRGRSNPARPRFYANYQFGVTWYEARRLSEILAEVKSK